MQIYKFTFPGMETYVGLTTRDIEIRFNEHCAQMAAGRHHSPKVQAVYNKYRLFPKITILETCSDIETLKLREIQYIEKLNTYYNGLNSTRGGDIPDNSKLSEDDYLDIVSFLASTDLTAKEIANELNVPYSIVNNISSGYTHKYLQDILPVEYEIMLKKVGTRSKKIHDNTVYHKILLDLVYTNKTYKEISDTYNVGTSIVAGISGGYKHKYLELEYPDTYNKLMNLRGSRKHGIIPNKLYSVVSPDGIIFEFTNISEFSRAHNLTTSSLNRLVNGKLKSHKGWTVLEASKI